MIESYFFRLYAEFTISPKRHFGILHYQGHKISTHNVAFNAHFCIKTNKNYKLAPIAAWKRDAQSHVLLTHLYMIKELLDRIIIVCLTFFSSF